jgi:hypothetical protein
LPLSARARIEVYLPDLFSLPSQELLILFNDEFTHTFGGATLWRGVLQQIVVDLEIECLVTQIPDEVRYNVSDMGLDSVLVITDQMADNLIMASRNLANVLIVEPRYADPLALVHYKKVLVTKGAMEQLKEMLS